MLDFCEFVYSMVPTAMKNDNDTREEFTRKLAERQVPSEVAEWFYVQMSERWKLQPSLSQLNNIDPGDWYDLIVEGTIELGHFRPSALDVKNGANGFDFSKFVHFAEVIAKILQEGPDVGDEVVVVNANNSSGLTRIIWRSLAKLDRYEYNGQFFLKCYLDSSTLSLLNVPTTIYGKVQTFLGKNFFWLNWMGIERDIKRSGYVFHKASSLSECKPRIGSVLKIKKETTDLQDNFRLLLLVTEVEAGQIKFVEFKESWNSPFKVSLAGLENFFFRDGDTKVEGIWNLEN